jgi:hypothetical protein
VLGADKRVVKVAGLFLSEYEYSSGPVCEALKQWSSFVSLEKSVMVR